MRYKQLAQQCIQQIESGQLAVNSKMPSLRNFKLLHNVSMTTALNCYQHLESLGWLLAKPQSGYYVVQQSIMQGKPNTPTLVNFKSITTQPQLPSPYNPFVDPCPLGIARYDPELMPIVKLQQSVKRAIKQQGSLLSHYPDPQGELCLRENLSKHFQQVDFHFSAEQCVVTHGCLDAIRTAIEITTEVGDAVAISSPCFSGLLELLGVMKRAVVEIPSVEEGIDLEQLQKQMQLGTIKAGLFCTSHMNPQGTSMSALQKQKLVELATQYKIPIIEDDVYLELGAQQVIPLPAKHWDSEGYVLWCGSISKTIAAGYRLGWCLPGRYLDAYLRQRLFANQGVTSPLQLAIADFIERGDYANHLKKIRLYLQQQTRQYIHYLHEHLPVNSKISHPTGGFVLWVEVVKLNTGKLKQLARQNNLDIRIGDEFSTLGLYSDCFRLNIGFNMATTQINSKMLCLMELITTCLKE
ncbi:PLP-dependent aminotransferase family protein [Psychromonas sp. B3M02]|uniref:aminotransferase-like domain-containing protein n=1 Tax=Psychromonas sp. B3M02 TaxID=2267226 RepID=UPI000DEABF1C|nr:PLP-dependent aminotransferase family protein [Psychromonas sp. B3M02]RBW46496.1 PLP-dependent aminotransferase family protein [Psychromonas sp. B3M02]